MHNRPTWSIGRVFDAQIAFGVNAAYEFCWGFKSDNIIFIGPTLQQVAMEVDIDAVGEQLKIFHDQYKEKSQEYDRLFEELNQTSQVQRFITDFCFIEVIFTIFCWHKLFNLNATTNPQHCFNCKDL